MARRYGKKKRSKSKKRHGKRKSATHRRGGHRRKRRGGGRRKRRSGKGRRRSAAKRRYIGSPLHKYNLARKRGKRSRRGHRRGKKGGRKSRRSSGGGVRLSPRDMARVEMLIKRGRSPAQAHRAVARLARIRAGHAKRYFTAEAESQRKAGEAANFFAGIAGAGRAAHAGL